MICQKHLKHLYMPQTTERTRDLRKRQTPAEQLLWQELRNRKLMGKKFLRQHALFYEDRYKYFIADFYCAELRLVIEVDGGIHERQREYDAMRTHILNGLGITVVRFRNEEVEGDMRAVLGGIRGHVATHPPS